MTQSRELCICGCEQILTGRQKKYASAECAKREGRRQHIWRCFSITLDEYDRILEEQDGGCGICGRPPKAQKSLAVDHDHVTGFVRGLLCFFCNKRVLSARSADIIIKTANYVTDPPARRALGRDVVAPGRPARKRKKANRLPRGKRR